MPPDDAVGASKLNDSLDFCCESDGTKAHFS